MDKGSIEYLPIHEKYFSDLDPRERVFYRDQRDKEVTEPVRAVVVSRRKLEKVVDTRLPGQDPVSITGRPGVPVQLQNPYSGKVPERQFPADTCVLAQPGDLFFHYSFFVD